jgi:phosphoglycerate dehydrogenase-like enzyme
MGRGATTVLAQVRMPLVERIRAAVPGVAVVPVASEDDLAEGVTGEVLLTLPWGTPNLAAVLARGVRWVHAAGTGVDGFPFELLGDRTLTCSRGASAVPIAEWVLAVMLAFEKRLPQSWIDGPPEAGWSRARLGTLAGKTLGLLGLGSIGTAVAERALAFGMRVRAVRRTAAGAPVAGIEVVGSLEDMLAPADHVVLAAPATPATHHIIGASAFAAMKPGTHLVNVARGTLVDQDALRAALDDGRVARASLDAVDPEPLPAGHWLYEHPRARVSPHVSWNMPEAADVLIDRFIDNLRRWCAGEPLAGIVDRAAGY